MGQEHPDDFAASCGPAVRAGRGGAGRIGHGADSGRRVKPGLGRARGDGIVAGIADGMAVASIGGAAWVTVLLFQVASRPSSGCLDSSGEFDANVASDIELDTEGWNFPYDDPAVCRPLQKPSSSVLTYSFL